jgi:hypothetical protein
MRVLVVFPPLHPHDFLVNLMMVWVLVPWLDPHGPVVHAMVSTLLLLPPLPLAVIGIGNARERRTSLSPVLVPFGEGEVEVEWERRRAWRRRRASVERASRWVTITIEAVNHWEGVWGGEDGAGQTMVRLGLGHGEMKPVPALLESVSELVVIWLIACGG